jgi:hypothetical protein
MKSSKPSIMAKQLFKKGKSRIKTIPAELVLDSEKPSPKMILTKLVLRKRRMAR